MHIVLNDKRAVCNVCIVRRPTGEHIAVCGRFGFNRNSGAFFVFGHRRNTDTVGNDLTDKFISDFVLFVFDCNNDFFLDGRIVFGGDRNDGRAFTDCDYIAVIVNFCNAGIA